MNFLKKFFGKKEEKPVASYWDFWDWFLVNERLLYETVKNKKNIHEKFVDPVITRLQQLNDQFYCLVGMYDEEVAELVISAEGDVKTFVFVEELVSDAPVHQRWKFTALKPAMGIGRMSINMEGYEFNNETLSFFSNDHADHPDEIDVTIVHRDYTEENKDAISRGTLIYLDNALGELNTAILFDSISFCGKQEKTPALIPMEKMLDFLLWREKEFVEKYNGIRHDTANDRYSSFEAEDENGLPVIAVINQDLMDWDARPSHPWMMPVTINYPNANNGMPDQYTYDLMDEFENELMAKLPDAEGYLNLGRQTHDATRKIYFACKEFRHSSKIVAGIINSYSKKLEISYTIYKDKYWMTMDRYSTTV